MPTPPEILELVERFNRNADTYRSVGYNEATLRHQFLDPFFKALGWDVHNEQGTAEAYKDVLHEEAIKVGGATKAPDYCFRFGCLPKFFVEAKKPAVNIKEDASPAYQLRRYAWSAKLPLSILSDFEELAVYDCRIKPAVTDSAATGRILLLGHQQYAERWDEIASIFSRDAVRTGSFDKYAETTRGKKGTAEVDAAFLKDIESWRDELARNLALRNPRLTQRELNFAVQRTIDRIIFLRIAEDRGIEDYNRLMALTNGERVYARLSELFERADERYNSGLFHFHQERDRAESPDELTLRLKIDDDKLREIIRSLYYPESPYEFSVLPADILGQVYEQFLGKVIRLTGGHRAVVEDKPEVKKAGGVYYTPTYIVDYIVRQTVGKLLEGKTPRQAAKLRVLDPACGSGSFLIGAYQYLLDWHRDQYEQAGPAKHTRELFQGPGGAWRLTTAERKRILLANIYGVDIDAQAVETTKLSLLLKVLEGENRETLERQRRILHQRALPDLGNNIKCGNSLIGPDFFNGQQLSLYDEEDRLRVNIFDWRAEFAEGMKGGGFDAVIGNPPYIRIQRIDHDESDYLFKKYRGPTSKTDLSLVFLEQGLNLTSKAGFVGFICTSQWLTTDYGRNLREMLSDGRLHDIVDFGSLPVFQNASTYPAIFVLSPTPHRVLKFKRISNVAQLNLDEIMKVPVRNISLTSLSVAPWSLGQLDIAKLLTARRAACKPLEQFGKAYIGTKSGMTDVFVMTRSAAKQLHIEREVLLPYAYQGAEVDRYCDVEPDAVIIYPYREGQGGKPELISEPEMRTKFPNAFKHLLSQKKELRKRQDSRRLYAAGPDWYRHLRAGSFNYIRPPKLTIKGIARRCSAGLLKKDTAFDGANCPSIIIEQFAGHDLLYFLGILNSRVATYYLRSVCPPKLSGYTRFSASVIGTVPIRLIDHDDRQAKKHHDNIAELAESMLTLNRKLAGARTAHERTALERQIGATDHQIDKLVYDLYGLTEEEIAIVEAATTSRPTAAD